MFGCFGIKIEAGIEVGEFADIGGKAEVIDLPQETRVCWVEIIGAGFEFAGLDCLLTARNQPAATSDKGDGNEGGKNSVSGRGAVVDRHIDCQ